MFTNASTLPPTTPTSFDTPEHRAYMNAVTVSDGVVTVNRDFHVPLNRCNDHEGLVRWLYHLSSKSWVTPDMIKRFMEVVSSETGIKTVPLV